MTSIRMKTQRILATDGGSVTEVEGRAARSTYAVRGRAPRVRLDRDTDKCGTSA